MAQNLQQMRRPHDIRSAIPFTKMTDPANFPMHVHRDYPKMLLRSNPNPKSKTLVVPVLDELEQPVVVMDEDEERDFLKANPEIAEDIRKSTPKSAADRLADDNELMRKMIAEREDLQARLKAAEERASKAEAKAAAPKPSKAPKPAAANKNVNKGGALPNNLKGNK